MPTPDADDGSTLGPEPVHAPQSQDTPSPEVTALYLRPTRPRSVGRDRRGRYAHDRAAAAGALDADQENLADAITRVVSGLLERHLREAVVAAVRALAPRLVVSLPPGARETPPATTPETVVAPQEAGGAAGVVATEAERVEVPDVEQVARQEAASGAPASDRTP